MARIGTAPLRRQPRGTGTLTAPRAALDGFLARGSARKLLIVVVACLVAAAALYLIIEKTPISAVSDVRVVGVHGVDAAAIEKALESSAREMSTLSVDDEALLASVARFKVVRSVHTSASFPHGLLITVDEQLPAAVVNVDGAVTVAASDGVLLGPAFANGSVPRVDGTFRIAGGRLQGPHAAGLLAIAGAAPRPLAARVERIYYGPRGITAVFHGGLQVYFGDGSLPHAKWISLIRVLLAPTSHGASSIDVRVPARPAAAFAEGSTAAASSPVLSGEALISSLTAGLAGGEPSPPTGAAATPAEPQSSTAAPEQQQAEPAPETAPAGEPQPAG